MTQAEEVVEDMQDLYHQWGCLAQEAGKAEKEWEKMCRQVQDSKSVLRGEIEKHEQDLNCKREELAQLEARREVLEASGLALRVPASIPGMAMGASAGPSAPKKKNKTKKTPWPALTRRAGVL